MAEQFQFEFSDGGSLDRLAARINTFLGQMDEARRRLEGSGASTQTFDIFGQDFQARINRAKANIEEIRRQIERTNQALERERGPGSRIAAGAGSEDRLRTQLAEQRTRLAQEELALNSLLAAEKSRAVEIEARELALTQEKTRAEQERANLLSQLQVTRPGGDKFQQAIEERRNALLERRRELLDQLVATRSQLREELPENVGTKQLEQEQRLAEDINKLKDQQLAKELEIAKARRQASAIDVQQRQQGQGRGPRNEQETLALAEARRGVEQELNRLSADALRIETQIQEKQQQRAQTLERIRALERRGGAIAGSAEIIDRIGAIDQALNSLEVDGLQELNRLTGQDLTESFDQLIGRVKRLQSTDLTPEDAAAEMADIRRSADDLFNTLQRAGQEGLPTLFDPQELLAGFGVLERTVLGAFQGLGQRFRATLQFALSGSLIFAGQRLAREFFESIVDVQRSFADIASSLEFDIDFERGSVQFEQQLEGIRRQVLQIANDFNVLPTEANAAAFQMVSRFQDVEAAMIATRAQLLATKVATIDQSEALRALTAVAESYGQTIDRNIQGQQRQVAIAKLYSQALDGAVAIQQAFGISVEDTIEGSAGLAELLAAEGFSLAQTQAAIAQVIQRTGVTGATAADRLGRSLGQLTNPQIRDEVLALAAANEELTLTLTDFTDGEEALRAINAELARIRTVAPEAAADLQNQLAQIIGQRRETAFIAPLLGTADTQREIVDVIEGSAGAAERRFSFLEQTVSELLESIKTRFEQIAQEVERLGLLTPLQLFLSTLDRALGLLNQILRVVGNLVQALNRIRIPFIDIGLGDALAQVLSLTLALRTLGTALNLGSFVFNQARAGGIVNLARGGVSSLFGRGRGSDASGAAEGAGLAFTGLVGVLGGAESAAGRATVGLRGMVQTLGRGQGVLGIVLAVEAAFIRLTTTLIANAAAALTAARAEGGLGFSRILPTLLTGLRGVLSFLARGIVQIVSLGGRLVGFGAAVAGAYAAVTGFIQALVEIPSTLGQTEEDIARETQETRQGRRREIQAESDGLPEAEAARQQLREEMEALEQEIKKDTESISAAARDFFLTVFENFLPGTQAEGPGTLSGKQTRLESARLELIDLELQDLFGQLDTISNTVGLGVTASIRLGSARDGLEGLQARFREVVDAINSGEISDIAAEAELSSIFQGLEIMQESVSRVVDGASTAIEGTAQTIREAVQRIGQQVQLGVVSPAEAQRLLQAELEKAQELVGVTEGQDRQALLDEITNIQLQQLQFFQQEAQFAQQLAGRIPNQVAALTLQVEIAKDFLERALTEMADRPQLILQQRLEVARLEAELAQAIKDEARARLELAVDSAKTFQAEIDALNALRQAILEQISIEAKKYVENPESTLPLEEQQALIGITDQISSIRLRQATLRARLAVLSNASSLNNIAAIQANIASLRAEIQFLRDTGEEDLIIREREIQLRDEIANLRQAEADRRAAFFRLTAGVGDDVKAAQAELRAAQDRLQTITDLGGAETQAGYEAELDVLRARQRLADLALEIADLQLRNASDLTDTLEQAFLDVEAAREQLAAAKGPLEKARAERDLAEATSRAQQEFYNQRLADLDFLFDTDQISRAQYIAALRQLQSGVDRTTRQGEEIWRDIERQIRGMEEDATDLQFNIPETIRLPTLFEVRRALQADQLGVNYMDNRQQDIQVTVTSAVDLQELIRVLSEAGIDAANLDYRRLGPGSAAITIGGF